MKNIIEENKKLVIIVGVLFILLIGVSFAYFQSQIGEAQQTDVKVLTKTVDRLTFESGDAINMSVGFAQFKDGMGSAISTKTFAKATLTANNDTNEATMSYYLYLAINNNDFKYTKDGNTPELLLHITDKNNEEINSIKGLEYKSVVDGNGITQTGFDVTTKTGILTLLNKKEITASPLTTDKWNIELIFVNYSFDQTANAGKTFNAEVLITSNEYFGPKYASDVCSEGDSISNCLIDLAVNGETSGLYHHTENLANSAGDNSYRYSGANPNNYICLSNADVCNENDLFRILQIIPDALYKNGNNNENISLIKVVSPLNYKNLFNIENFLYYHYDYIGIVSSDILNKPVSNLKSIPSTIYSTVNPDSNNYDISDWLSLTDYAYTASPSAWDKSLSRYNDSNIVSNNWLYTGNKLYISPSADTTEFPFIINEDGSVAKPEDPTINLDDYRIVEYLLTESQDGYEPYLGGDGTKENPIRINISYHQLA